jgi:hypothetical protein
MLCGGSRPARAVTGFIFAADDARVQGCEQVRGPELDCVSPTGR